MPTNDHPPHPTDWTLNLRLRSTFDVTVPQRPDEPDLQVVGWVWYDEQHQIAIAVMEALVDGEIVRRPGIAAPASLNLLTKKGALWIKQQALLAFGVNIKGYKTRTWQGGWGE